MVVGIATLPIIIERMTTELPHLLLIPGLLCNARLWASQTQSLADISCIDVPDLTEHESIPDMAEDLGPAVGIRQMRALLNYSGFRGDLADIVCPTTLICGREDQRTPVSAHVAMSEHIPQARVAVVEHAGHFTPLEQPDEVGAFLREWIRAPLKTAAG